MNRRADAMRMALVHVYSPRFGWQPIRLKADEGVSMLADRRERFLDADSALVRRRVFERGKGVNG